MKPFLMALQAVSAFPVQEVEVDDERVVATYFPVAGFAIGVILAILGWALLLLAPRTVGSLVGAILIPLVYSLLTKHHGFLGMAHVVDQWLENSSAPVEDKAALYRNVILVQTLVLVKFLFVGLVLFYRRPLWLVVVPMLGHCAWTDLLQPRAPGFSLAGSGTMRLPAHWVFATAVSLLIGLLCGSLAAGILAPLLAWLMLGSGSAFLRERLGEVRPTGIYAVTEKLEMLILLVGILCFAAAGG